MDATNSKMQRIFELYWQGAYIWQIASELDITESEVVATLGLG